MRKTKKCNVSSLTTEGGRLVVRTCFRERNHSGDEHMDSRGSWYKKEEPTDG